MMRNPDTPGRCRVGILLVPVFMARYYSMRGPGRRGRNSSAGWQIPGGAFEMR